MTKRKGADEQLWLLVGDDGTVQTVKKNRHDDEDDEEFIENQVEDDDDNDDGDNDDGDNDDGDNDDGDMLETLDAADPESVHHEVFIDQSQLVEEHEHDEINEEGDQTSDGGANDTKVESSSNNVEEDPTETNVAVVKWTDKATFRLLDLIEQVTAKESEVPGKSDRVWIRIAHDMKPFCYTAEDCHKKFKSMNRTYRTALERRSNNIPYKWRYFNRMCAVVGTKIPKRRTPPGLNTVQFPVTEPKPEPSTSVDDLMEEDEAEEVGLSKFDQLLKSKREMLTEVRHQGEILQRHVDESIASTLRREERENEMVKLLMDLKNQEQKKLELFRKLLDKLWYEFKFMLCLNSDVSICLKFPYDVLHC